MLGSDFVKWLRRCDKDDFRFLPVVVLTGHTQVSNVLAARDCGANIVVKKPVSSTALFEHMVWAANTERSFIEAENYVGPDRRFKFMGPPDGVGVAPRTSRPRSVRRRSPIFLNPKSTHS